MAGAPGFEPGNGGSKVRCLTTWRRPKLVRPKYRVAPPLVSEKRAGARRPVHERPGIVNVGQQPPPTMRPVAGLTTQPLSGALLRNPYPALPDTARNGFELRVHLQFREDVLDMRPDGVR